MAHFVKRWFALILLLVGLILFFYFGLNKYLTFSALKEHRTTLLFWAQEHYLLTVLIFMIIYTMAVAFSIPGATFFTLISGFLFGFFWGTIYVVVSATLGATFIFLAVKIALGPLIAKRANKWIHKMRAGFEKNAIQYLLILRFIPLFPFWMVNIVAAFFNITISTFMLTTFIGIIPGSAIYVLLGNGLGKLLDQNQTPNLKVIFEPHILLPLLALALISLLPIIYKMLKKESL